MLWWVCTLCPLLLLPHCWRGLSSPLPLSSVQSPWSPVLVPSFCSWLWRWDTNSFHVLTHCNVPIWLSPVMFEMGSHCLCLNACFMHTDNCYDIPKDLEENWKLRGFRMCSWRWPASPSSSFLLFFFSKLTIILPAQVLTNTLYSHFRFERYFLFL